MPRNRQRVVGKDESRSRRGDLTRERFDAGQPFRVRRDVPDVDGLHAARSLTHQRRIDLGILLPAVAYEQKWQLGVGVEDLTNYGALVSRVPLRETAQVPIAQEQRADRNALRLEEPVDDIVQVPRAAGDVEEGDSLPRRCAPRSSAR